MSWDDDDFDVDLETKQEAPKIVAAGSLWSDEEEENLDGVKDDWMMSSDEEGDMGEDPFGPTKVEQDKEKVTFSKVKKGRKAAAASKPTKKEEPEDNESAIEKKKRIEREQLKADLANACDLFGTDIEDVDPDTEQQVVDLATRINKTVAPFQGSSHYATFLKELLKQLLSTSSSEECQSLAKSLNVITNEKIQQEKRPKKKKKKNTNKVDREAVEADMVEDEYDFLM
mmetsp:Transcript_11837/g.47775  ORF Transcript_11837/g.47775 Transcript_11837/m.47775 type:complete len:228 (-) Transcript_11837:37-720(-)